MAGNKKDILKFIETHNSYANRCGTCSHADVIADLNTILETIKSGNGYISCRAAFIYLKEKYKDYKVSESAYRGCVKNHRCGAWPEESIE